MALADTLATNPTRSPRTSLRLDTVIDQALAERRLIGAVVQIAQDGRRIYSRAAGLADREANRLMREDALFRLASVSKPIVSSAALALVARGRLRLDDRVERWLPAFRPRLPDGSVPELTIRHLMTHTAGLSYRFFQPHGGSYERAGVSDGMDLVAFGLDENLRRIASVPLLYAPGTAWAYSIATDVLGGVIERVADKRLDQAVHDLVTAPLGMDDTAFVAVDPQRLAAAYADAEPQPRRLMDADAIAFVEGTAGFLLDPRRALESAAFPSGGAGMVGSAGDLLRLLETLRQGGGALLPANLVDDMGRNQIGDHPMAYWPGCGFGLGFTVLKDPLAAASPESVGTWRMGGTYGHAWFVDRARRLSVVAFTNTALEGMSGAFVTQLRDAVYADLAEARR